MRTSMAAVCLLAPACCLRLLAADAFSRLDEMWDNSAPVGERAAPSPGSGSHFDFVPPEPDTRDPLLTQKGTTVSVEELKHPLSGKSRTMIDEAQRYSRSGDYSEAIHELNRALKDPSAAPYAHAILGSVYLKIRRMPEALRELEHATALLPRFAAVHSNFAYALCATGQIERGLQEVEAALALDPSLTRPHFLKGVILLDRTSSDHDGWVNLQFAQREIPSAHLALALYYVRHGQDPAAQQQLQDFARLPVNMTLVQAQRWLTSVTVARVSAAEGLGLWRDSPR